MSCIVSNMENNIENELYSLEYGEQDRVLSCIGCNMENRIQ